MDNKMAVFNNREFGSIRVIEENGNYLFCGFDVAKALGYCPARTIFPSVPKSAGIRVQNRRRNSLWRLFRVGAV